MRDSVDVEPGYFGERLDRRRRTLIENWERIAKGVRYESTGSDVIGAYLLSENIFSENNGYKVRRGLSD